MHHRSVLLKETIEQLNIRPDGVYIDCTLGAGGHTRKILEYLPNGKMYAFDQDDMSIQFNQTQFKNEPRITIIRTNFSNLLNIVNEYQIGQIDGILADIGVSSDQFDVVERGFSFQGSAPLDMRMDQRQEFSAETLIASYSQQQLTSIFHTYGEEKWASRISQHIIREREISPITTTAQLAKICENAIPRKFWKAIHPATKTFQAIRIEVNDELNRLKSFINDAIDVLSPEGRLAIITFHSLEDRIVKQAFNKASTSCQCDYQQLPDAVKKNIHCDCGQVIKGHLGVKKPIVASTEEVRDNVRSRSAKLRVFVKHEGV